MERECHGYAGPVTRHSVLKISRQITNKIVGIIFVTSFFTWLIAVIHGIVVPNHRSQFNAKFLSNYYDATSISILIGFNLLSVVLTLIVFITLRWIPHVTRVTLWTFWIPVSMYIVLATYQTDFWRLYAAIGSVFSCLLIIVLLKTEWFHLSETVIKEACKMIIAVPSTMTFALFTHLLNLFFIAIIPVAMERLSWDISFIKFLSILINFFFGFWIVITVVALSFMTLSGTFAEYYYVENKGSVSLGTVLRIFTINCRYHIGTAAMYPLLGGIRALFYITTLALYLILKGVSKSEICFFVYNIFDPVILRIVLLGSATSCGITGKNFYDSMAHTMNLFMENPRRFLLVVKVTELLMIFSGALVLAVTGISILSYYVFLSGNDLIKWFQFLTVISSAVVSVMTLLTCLSSACYSIMLCLYDKVHRLENTVTPDSCVMNSNLRTALNHDGAPNWFGIFCGCSIPNLEKN